MTALYWMATADGELVTAPTIEDLVAAIFGADYQPGLCPVGRLEARLAYLAAFAERMQTHLIQEGVRSETFSFAGCSDRELETLRRPKTEDPLPGRWTGNVPLLVVQGGDGWVAPSGRVVVLDGESPRRFLLSMRDGGEFVTGLGLL